MNILAGIPVFILSFLVGCLFVYAECPSKTWLSFQSSCYIVQGNEYSYTKAKDTCNTHHEGSHLVAISSKEENDFVKSKLPKVGPFEVLEIWIGLWRCGDCVHDNEGDWEWQDGSAVNYEQWDQWGGEDSQCVRMLTNGSWRGTQCDDKFVFMCELDTEDQNQSTLSATSERQPPRSSTVGSLSSPVSLQDWTYASPESSGPDNTQAQTTSYTTKNGTRPSPSDTAAHSDEGSIANYVGAAVAGAAFVLIVVALVVMVIRCRRKSSDNSDKDGSSQLSVVKAESPSANKNLPNSYPRASNDRSRPAPPSVQGDSPSYKSLDEAVRDKPIEDISYTSNDYEELPENKVLGDKNYPDNTRAIDKLDAENVIDPYASTRSMGIKNREQAPIPTGGSSVRSTKNKLFGLNSVKAEKDKRNLTKVSDAIYAVPMKKRNVDAEPEVTLVDNKIYEEL